MKSGTQLLTDLFASVPDPGEEVGKGGGRIADAIGTGINTPNVDPALAEKEIAAVKALGTTLKGVIGGSQLACVRDLFHGEEREFFFDKMLELAGVVEQMPGLLNNLDVVHLHYFIGGCDWYVCGVDRGSLQAFGLCCIHKDEIGYLQLSEVSARAELDFHWTPKTLDEVRAERAGAVDEAEESDDGDEDPDQRERLERDSVSDDNWATGTLDPQT